MNVDYEREQALAEAADEALELDSDHATATLKEIVLAVPPTSRYYKYHDAYLRRCALLGDCCAVAATHMSHSVLNPADV